MTLKKEKRLFDTLVRESVLSKKDILLRRVYDRVTKNSDMRSYEIKVRCVLSSAEPSTEWAE